jgi:hypothetical protein
MATPPPQKQQAQQVSVQHVGRASSDELLRKFADPDAPRAAAATPPRRSLKRSSRRVASGLSARDSDASAAAGVTAAALAAPKRRRSIGGSTGLLLPTASARKARARRARADDAAGIGLLLAALERVSSSSDVSFLLFFCPRCIGHCLILVCLLVDVEEDCGGGVQDVRGEAPDQPRPAHQRHGLMSADPAGAPSLSSARVRLIAEMFYSFQKQVAE